jgi:hypothetical protein
MLNQRQNRFLKADAEALLLLISKRAL